MLDKVGRKLVHYIRVLLDVLCRPVPGRRAQHLLGRRIGQGSVLAALDIDLDQNVLYRPIGDTAVSTTASNAIAAATTYPLLPRGTEVFVLVNAGRLPAFGRARGRGSTTAAALSGCIALVTMMPRCSGPSNKALHCCPRTTGRKSRP